MNMNITWSKIKNKIFSEKLNELDNVLDEVSENILNNKIPRSKWIDQLMAWTNSQINNNYIKINLEDYLEINKIIQDLDENLLQDKYAVLNSKNRFLDTYKSILNNKEDNLKIEIAAELIKQNNFPIKVIEEWYSIHGNLDSEQFNEALGKFWGDVSAGAKSGSESGAKAGSWLGSGLGRFFGGAKGAGKHLLSRVWNYNKDKKDFENTKQQSIDILQKLKSQAENFKLNDNFLKMIDRLIEKLNVVRPYEINPKHLSKNYQDKLAAIEEPHEEPEEEIPSHVEEPNYYELEPDQESPETQEEPAIYGFKDKDPGKRSNPYRNDPYLKDLLSNKTKKWKDQRKEKLNTELGPEELEKLWKNVPAYSHLVPKPKSTVATTANQMGDTSVTPTRTYSPTLAPSNTFAPTVSPSNTANANTIAPTETDPTLAASEPGTFAPTLGPSSTANANTIAPTETDPTLAPTDTTVASTETEPTLATTGRRGRPKKPLTPEQQAKKDIKDAKAAAKKAAEDEEAAAKALADREEALKQEKDPKVREEISNFKDIKDVANFYDKEKEEAEKSGDEALKNDYEDRLEILGQFLMKLKPNTNWWNTLIPSLVKHGNADDLMGDKLLRNSMVGDSNKYAYVKSIISLAKSIENIDDFKNYAKEHLDAKYPRDRDYAEIGQHYLDLIKQPAIAEKLKKVAHELNPHKDIDPESGEKTPRTGEIPGQPAAPTES